MFVEFGRFPAPTRVVRIVLPMSSGSAVIPNCFDSLAENNHNSTDRSDAGSSN